MHMKFDTGLHWRACRRSVLVCVCAARGPESAGRSQEPPPCPHVWERLEAGPPAPTAPRSGPPGYSAQPDRAPGSVDAYPSLNPDPSGPPGWGAASRAGLPPGYPVNPAMNPVQNPTRAHNRESPTVTPPGYPVASAEPPSPARGGGGGSGTWQGASGGGDRAYPGPPASADAPAERGSGGAPAVATDAVGARSGVDWAAETLPMSAVPEAFDEAFPGLRRSAPPKQARLVIFLSRFEGVSCWYFEADVWPGVCTLPAVWEALDEAVPRLRCGTIASMHGCSD